MGLFFVFTFGAMVDFLVVGIGLAGLSFCEQLLKNGKSFRVLSDTSQNASLVAGGLYNPVVLKRFTLAWQADAQLAAARPFYQEIADHLGVVINDELPILRRFASIEEQNLWFEATEKQALRNFLSPTICSNENSAILAPFGFGQVLHTGKIDTAKLITSYIQFLKNTNRFLATTLHYNQLCITDSYVEYGAIRAKNIVFCEGHGICKNKFFNYLPLQGNKGELLTIHAPTLQEDKILKASVFLIPLGNNQYRVGATYDRTNLTNLPTTKAKLELAQKLQVFLQSEYQVLDHRAGIRPTVQDRRPLVGTHPELHNLHVLNGLGSRGVLVAPWASAQLLAQIEKGIAVTDEINIDRFRNLYQGN